MSASSRAFSLWIRTTSIRYCRVLSKKKDMERVLIFTRTKHRADKIAEMLNKNKINADAIHGNKSQNQRTKAMHDFKSGHLRVLVATDIAAQGH